MAIDVDEVIDDLNSRRELALAKYRESPSPSTDKAARDRLAQEIAGYGLAQHVVELEMNGYTILPPGKGAPVELVDRVRDAVSRVAHERRDYPQRYKDHGAGNQFAHLLPEDPVFEEVVMTPVMLTLVTYLVGYRAHLSLINALIKTNESDAAFPFHTDISSRVPRPWPSRSITANVNWLLTDYNRENGALCVVPGSHLWCEPPPPSFRMAHDHQDVIVVDAPAGSMVVWHSNLWHGALPRTAVGRRMLMIMLFSRPHVQPSEEHWLTTTSEMIERNEGRFGVLTGLVGLNPWCWHQGPRPDLAPDFPTDWGKWV
jgi:ectoine hydroxylase-related dioxygenase (phytanoyl-CoA dioxygenase family)